MESISVANAVLLFGAALALVGILSSLVAQRFGAPLLLVFIGLGMLVGEDGPVGIGFDDYWLTYLVGSLALAIILFDGGLRTRFQSFRSALAPALMLATIGVLITALLTGLAAKLLLQLSMLEALLVGSVVASTDAAAVFFLMRAGGLQLPRRIGATLEIESGANDPIAVFLTVALVTLVQATQSGEAQLGSMVVLLIQQAVIGTGLGIAGGLLIALVLNKVELPAGLHPLFVVSAAVAIFALAALLEGSGFLAVYLAGLVLGNRRIRAMAEITAFHDTATWLCQIVMFFVLGLLVTPSDLVPHLLPAIGVSLVLILFARPLAVGLCLAPFGFRRKELVFMSWVGLRGAVSIFLAAIPTLADTPQAEVYFNVAFVVVLVSLLLQGWTLTPVAKALGVALPGTLQSVYRVEIDLPGQLVHELVGYHIGEDAPALESGAIPRWARLTFVIRDNIVLEPRDAGALRPGDYGYFLAPPNRVGELDALFVAEEETPLKALPNEFPIRADVPIGILADMYGLDLEDGADREKTVAEVFQERYEGELKVGNRLRFGPATLVARSIAEDRLVRVGLRLEERDEEAPPLRIGARRLRAFARRALERARARGVPRLTGR